MNSKADAIIERGRELTDIACQKSLEIIERAKIQLKIQDTKIVARRAYIELGKIAYEQIKNGTLSTDPKMKLLESDIDSANYRIKLLTRELCELKGAKLCRECGTLNPERSKFCSECASPLKND